VLAVFVTFLVSSAVRRPVPSVNEPHYLGKARHYWQPDWCAGDLFLESSNPHRVFYQTVGVITRWMTLPQSAWTGRLLALACLAWGWTRLLSRLLPGRWQPLGAAWVFLLLQSLGNFSGEWLVGGVEAKVFAYAFVFAGLASGLERRWVPAGIWIGLAISFHVIIGLWAVVAALLGTAGFLYGQSRTFDRSDKPRNTHRQCSFDRNAATLGGAALLLCALPGLLPALGLLRGGDPALAAQADRLQVGTRLSHHLDPMQFPLSDYRYYALLLVLAAILWRTTPSSTARRWFAWFVGATLMIAATGVLIGWGPRPLSGMPFSILRVWWLKFYPFRLADLFVPILVSVTVMAACHATLLRSTLSMWQRRAIQILAAVAFLASLVLPTPDRNPSRMTAAKQADWLDVCRWIREQTPADALLYAANEDWAVKWFAERPEFVNYKDCPQDTEGIIEWARRLRLVNGWAGEAFTDGRCSADELAQLHTDTGITHLTASRLGPIDLEPAYRNGHFRVYAIGPD
ncbi:MAG: DUF6798 domain-containing protein, partial [Planctomycetaceae bacterium]